MTPTDHALMSVEDFGGEMSDYIQIHLFLDQTKFYYPNTKHRAILHNSFGMGLCEQFFGDHIVNSDNQPIAVREIARRHIIQDCGRVPTLQEWLNEMPQQQWMMTVDTKSMAKLKSIKESINVVGDGQTIQPTVAQ